MKNRILYFLLLTLFLTTNSSNSKLFSNQKNTSPATFRVASYNIRCDVQADVKSGNAWDLRKKPLADLIINYDFDMVGVQGEPTFRIDYIFVSKNITVEDFTVNNDTYDDNRYPSDHFPLGSKIVIF